MSTKEKLYNLPQHQSSHNNLQLLRVISTSNYLKIDVGYYATEHYIRGGWVRMSKDTFIKVLATGEKKKLIKTSNIPIAPKQLNFNTTHDWLYFSLYFEPISKQVKAIDIIENELSNPTDFNFFNIQLEHPTEIKK
jgi:hypothetical protein